MRNFKNTENATHTAKGNILRITLYLFLFVFCPFINAQIKPFVKMAGAVSSYNQMSIGTFDASLAAGVQVNEHIYVQIGVNNLKRIFNQLDIVTISISPSLRILKSKYPVSPIIGIDVGTQVWSNGNNRFVDWNYNFTSYSSEYGPNYHYKRRLFFTKVKLLADFKINQFNLNLMVGPTFNLMYFKIEEVGKNWFTGEDYSVTDAYIDERRGFGFELSLMYTFPMKKRQAKNSDVGD